MVGNRELEHVDYFKYLGTMASEPCGLSGLELTHQSQKIYGLICKKKTNPLPVYQKKTRTNQKFASDATAWEVSWADSDTARERTGQVQQAPKQHSRKTECY